MQLTRGRTLARQPGCLPRRQRDGVTAVAVRHSVLRASLAATTAPLRLRHAGPAAQDSAKLLGRPEALRGNLCPSFSSAGPSQLRHGVIVIRARLAAMGIGSGLVTLWIEQRPWRNFG